MKPSSRRPDGGGGAPNVTDRDAEIESRLEKLEAAVRSLQERIDAESFPERPEPESEPDVTPESPPDEPATGIGATLSLAGRTCLAFGGAFLIRAATEAAILSPAGGAACGLLYAAAFLVLSDRDGRRGRRASAALHGLTSVAIAYPLLWEVSTRFHVFGPAGSVAAVVALTGVAGFVAWRQPTSALAWGVTIAAVATLAALLVATAAIEPVAAALLLVLLGTIWLAYGRHWAGPRWLAAVSADVAIAVLAGLAARPGGPPGDYRGLSIPGALMLAIALPIATIASFAIRTLLRRRGVTPFEAVQSAIALLVGLGGAISVARMGGRGVALLGVGALAAGLAGYGVAFAFVERRKGLAQNFQFYASLALLTTLAGAALWLAPEPLSLLWCTAALAAALLGGVYRRQTLRWHAVAYLAAATVSSGLAAAALDAFLAPPGQPWHPLARAALATAAAAVASYAMLAASRRPDAEWRRRLPALAVAVLAVAGIGAVAVEALLVTDGKAAVDAAFVAVVRTGVLTTSAVALAAAGRVRRVAELAWLAYPILGVGAIKLLVEDIPHGRPLTLFLGLAFYGGALLTTPRLLRRPRAAGARA
jgi:hypothetical protein